MDTDTWYHLNSGRFIVEHSMLPGNSFFSFISPPRPWVDYYWFFQVIVYKIYSFSDYYGLIILRAIAYTGTLSLIFYFAYKRRKEYDSTIYFFALFVLYFLFLQGRFQNVRPHLFSYFFIVIFILALEFRTTKLMYVLPVFAVLWSNLHGIMYPVMLLVIFSYVTEVAIVAIRNRLPLRRDDLLCYGTAILSAGAILLTPHGMKLLSIPFTTTEFASIYIGELKRFDPASLLFLQSVIGVPSDITMFSIFAALVLISLIASCIEGRARISHLLLCAGGLFLLFKGVRFTYEFALLSLPLLCANAPQTLQSEGGKWKRVMTVLIVCLIAIAPVMTLAQRFGNAPRYPFSKKGLPAGIARFLCTIPAGGTILNHPNNGGYLQWMVYPRHKIFMDMEVPFLFTDHDFFMASSAFQNEYVLKKIIDAYEPSFISVPIGIAGFRDLIKKFGQYRPVFFDDAEVLYMNRGYNAHTVSEFELTVIDPFEIAGKTVDVIVDKKKRGSVKNELSRMLRIFPEGLMMNQIMGEICLDEKNYRKTMDHAHTIISAYPESPVGYKLKGKALVGLKRSDQADICYGLALKRSSEREKPDLYKRLATIYIEQGKFGKAYEAARQGVAAFAPETNYAALYQLGSAALLSGRKKEAETVLRMGYDKVPDSDAVWKENYRKLFAVLPDTNKKK